MRLKVRWERLRHAALVGVVAVGALAAGCGPGEPGLCEDMREGALTPWVENEWEPYCGDLYEHLEEPGNYSLLELTKYFATHEERRDELRIGLKRFDEPEQCFQEPAEQLRFRSLESCLNNPEAMERRIAASWSARSEPWIDEYEGRVKRLRQRLADSRRLADTIDMKLEQKFDFSSPMDPGSYENLASQLVQIREDMDFMDQVTPQYESFVAAASGEEMLSELVKEKLEGRVEATSSLHKKNRLEYAKLNFEENYMRFAVYSVGQVCPEGVSARKETKAAKEALGIKFSELGGPRSKVRITQKFTVEENEAGDKIQRTSGFFCAPRGPDNQFDGRPKLCGIHDFTVKRVKLAGERRFSDWQVEQIGESEYDKGADCELLKAKKK